MPIAKENLYIGFTLAAVPGNYVTKEAVKANGWQSKVDDGPDYGGTERKDKTADAGGNKVK